MSHTRLADGPEFGRIRALAERWREHARGLGDDCAFLEAGGATLAVSVDLSVEDVHFRRAWLSPDEIGYRAAAGALSDLAAVAAEPMALLLAVGMPASEPEATLLAVGDGVAGAAAAAGAVIVGGDLSRSDKLIIDCCVIGRADTPVRRAGARPGDQLVVTGSLGGPLAALEAWQRGETPDPEARERFARPASRHQAARWLARNGARAMIDLSDGLGGDLRQLLAASGVGAAVDVTALPVMACAYRAVKGRSEPAWQFAARSGEEYELLAALPADVGRSTLALSPVPLTMIGAIEAGADVRAHLDGRPVSLPGGHDHFGAR